MEAFYRWQESDFIQIPVNQVQKGDKIAMAGGKGLLYGAITIDDVAVVEDIVLLQYRVPIGAIMHSDENLSLSVYWKNGKADIYASDTQQCNKRVSILKRKGS